MLLTIMSSVAQEESRSISENVLWGVHKRFEEGRYHVGYSHFLGYDRGKDGKLVVNPVQAETVRYIFRRFLEGKTPYTIAEELMEQKMKTGAGNIKWSSDSVMRILKNEKYCGNAILQKTYKKDLLSKRRTNNGEVRKFFVENGHEAIVTPEQFDMAQQELADRKKESRQHSAKSIFSSKLRCGCCDSFFGSKVWHSTDRYRRVIWQCNRKFHNEVKCTTPHLREEKIKDIFLDAVNQLVTDREPALEAMRNAMARVKDTGKLEEELKEAERDFENAVVLFQDYLDRTALTESDITDGRYVELEKRYIECSDRKDRLRDELTDRRRRAAAIGRFIDEVSSFENIFTEFSDDLWLGLSESILINTDGTAVVEFKSGMKIAVSLQ